MVDDWRVVWVEKAPNAKRRTFVLLAQRVDQVRPTVELRVPARAQVPLLLVYKKARPHTSRGEQGCTIR